MLFHSNVKLNTTHNGQMSVPLSVRKIKAFSCDLQLLPKLKNQREATIQQNIISNLCYDDISSSTLTQYLVGGAKNAGHVADVQ